MEFGISPYPGQSMFSGLFSLICSAIYSIIRFEYRCFGDFIPYKIVSTCIYTFKSS